MRSGYVAGARPAAGPAGRSPRSDPGGWGPLGGFLTAPGPPCLAFTMRKYLAAIAGLHVVGLSALLSRSMAHGTAEEVSAKWLSRLQQATSEMQAGVQRVTTAPGQAAAAKRQKWINALSDTAVQDKWARNVASVSLSQWQQAMTDYGINRVAQGAQAKQAKFTNIMSSLLTYIDQGVQTVSRMDDSNYAAREQRALAMMRWMRDYKRPAS